MFASRSDVLVRIKPYRWIAAASFGFFLVASLLLPAPPAHGATSASKRARAKAVADSLARAGSRDEGISVRVIEDGKQTTSKGTRSSRATPKETDETVRTYPSRPRLRMTTATIWCALVRTSSSRPER